MYRVSAVEAETCLTFVALQCVVPRVCSEIKVGDHKVHTTENPSVGFDFNPVLATLLHRGDSCSTGTSPRCVRTWQRMWESRIRAPLGKHRTYPS